LYFPAFFNNVSIKPNVDKKNLNLLIAYIIIGHGILLHLSQPEPAGCRSQGGQPIPGQDPTGIGLLFQVLIPLVGMLLQV
jgi:hypothetical protein